MVVEINLFLGPRVCGWHLRGEERQFGQHTCASVLRSRLSEVNDTAAPQSLIDNGYMNVVIKGAKLLINMGDSTGASVAESKCASGERRQVPAPRRRSIDVNAQTDFQHLASAPRPHLGYSSFPSTRILAPSWHLSRVSLSLSASCRVRNTVLDILVCV